MAHDVFVSYSSKDKNIADTIVATMELNQIRCWYAPRDIKPSEDWGKAISNAIERSKVFLIIFSGNANESQRVLDELNLAISEQIVVFPFRVENLEPRGAMKLHLSSRHWLDAYEPTWQNHIKKLVKMISTNLNAPLDEKEIDVPKSLKQRKSTIKFQAKGRIIVGILIGIIAISAIWYALTKPTLNEQNSQGSNISSTGEVLSSADEALNIQETSLAETEAASSISMTHEYVTTEADEPTPEAPEDLCQIVYLSTLSGNANLWTMKPDGSDQKQLSFNQYGDIYSNWSPDGTQIAFNSGRDGDHEIYLMNVDGTNIRQLTTNDVTDVSPSWSPNGEKIAFFSNRDGDFEIWMMDTDGRNVQQLTTDRGSYGENEYLVFLLSWSPDGEQIVYASDYQGDKDIYIMNVDGSDFHQLTTDSAVDEFPDWSPDGDQILFQSDRYGDPEIFLMDLDGSNLRQMTSNNGESIYANWSPDGTQIIFSSDRDGDFEIWIMDANGSNQKQLTFNEAKEFLPEWSPFCD